MTQPLPWPVPPGGTDSGTATYFRPRFGSGVAAKRIRRFLRYTYTRRAPVDPTTAPPGQPFASDEGAWGDLIETYQPTPGDAQPVPVAPTPAVGTATAEPPPSQDNVPCLYWERDRYVLGDQGPVLVHVIQLYVAPDDPISYGWQVSNVREAGPNGRIIYTGPATVRAMQAGASNGKLMYQIAQLEELDVANQ